MCVRARAQGQAYNVRVVKVFMLWKGAVMHSPLEFLTNVTMALPLVVHPSLNHLHVFLPFQDVILLDDSKTCGSN